MSSLPAEIELSKVQTRYWEIVEEISVIISDTNTLISLLEKKQTSDRREITKQSKSIVTKCSKLAKYFIDKRD
jgi:predicted transcriptional regulator